MYPSLHQTTLLVFLFVSKLEFPGNETKFKTFIPAISLDISKLTIIPQMRVGYEVIDSWWDAKLFSPHIQQDASEIIVLLISFIFEQLDT